MKHDILKYILAIVVGLLFLIVCAIIYNKPLQAQGYHYYQPSAVHRNYDESMSYQADVNASGRDLDAYIRQNRQHAETQETIRQELDAFKRTQINDRIWNGE